MMNSQRDNACKSMTKVSFGSPQICLDAADGHIDFRHFSGVRIWFLSEDEDIIIAPAVRFDEFHGLHKHPPESTARISKYADFDTTEQ